ncbi:DUF4393 domain-containing protein [Paenibacillus sepulcri]|uniref:DUF4393 domain-containing protein n=1 Tax=Paenibacillus sepulcri TaxID=359917 RepID=A0ABS7BUX4_9BACL|nr:DUF4393 domain-containing protein [Paenibacillus sepulcri]
MNLGDVLGVGKLSDNGLELIKLIYPDLAQPALKKVGMALETVLDLSNTILLPLKLMNEKVRMNGERHLKSYQEKLNSYPEESIGSVPPEIGLPVLDELLRVTNEEIADLFTNLLVNASLIEKSKFAHPSFIHILKNISVDEARIINYYKDQRNMPILVINYLKSRENWQGEMIGISEFFINLDENIDLLYKENRSFYFQNLSKFGLFEDGHNFPHSMSSVVENKGAEILSEEKRLQELIDNEVTNENGIIYSLHDVRSHIYLSDYGKEFVKSISVN